MTQTRRGLRPATGRTSRVPRIVIVGGGYVGMYTALHLRRKLRRNEADVCVIDPKSYMTYQPFLPEAAAGNLAERHVVAPLRQVLRGVQVLNGSVTAISHAGRYVDFRPLVGDVRRIGYDLIVIAPGSISRTLQIDGLADHGIGFKTVGEAIYLRNHVLTQLDIAASTQDLKVRRRTGGHGAGRLPLLPRSSASRHAMDAGRSDRPHPSRGRSRDGPPRHRRAAHAGHRRSAQHPFGFRRGRPDRVGRRH